ncbi:GTP-binding protein 10 homolog [Onthophagus taurus]|uniref:GTP-binding protein 10 homolog n=1 Tax=Onthophagus taurus TaxID=166361 RepID=UPI0039BDEACE
MVYISKILLFPIKKQRKYLQSGFIDTLRLFVKAGSGGNGLPKFGGVGGQGGNVYLVGNENLTLENVRSAHKTKKIAAKHGRNSTHNFILGVPGENVKIEVPTGISILTDDGAKLGEINKEGEEIIVAKGGQGGHSKNDYIGRIGESHSIKLDLKLISDIGLVGFPNAGKSTVLKAVSQANPKIASYPFTTIRPNVGIISYKDLRQISMADLPGLIEGAHINKGMGHKFLKHVERTKMILLVVDVNGFQLSPQHPFRNCFDTIILLNKELEMYNPDLLNKPTMIVINKMDVEGANEKYLEVKKKINHLSDYFGEYPIEIRPEIPLKFQQILAISAQTNKEDIEVLKNKLRTLLDVCYQDNKVDEFKTLKDTIELQKEKGPRLV